MSDGFAALTRFCIITIWKKSKKIIIIENKVDK